MKRLLQGLLIGYKRWISPMLPNACRFVPSCSEYALEAIEMHGILHGSVLATWRLLRCNPFVRGGYDPVPSAHAGCCHVVSKAADSAAILKR